MHCNSTEDVDQCRWLQFVAQPVWKLGSQKKSWFQMVSVSDGFGTFWQCSHLSDPSSRMPGFGTVEFGVVCDGFGRLSFFVLQ